MTKRALTSASNLYRRLLCPGSARMEKDLPDIRTKESMQGDRLHDYWANPHYERSFLIPEEQDLLRIIDQLSEEAFDVIGLQDEFEEQREVYMEDEALGIGGHPDLMRVYAGSNASIVIDGKFGWSPVAKADVNLQTRVYAYLAPTNETYVGIAQPRAYGADRLTVARYGIEAKLATRSQIFKILERTADPNAPLNPSEEACRYCRARYICPALQEAVQKEIVVFTDLADDKLSKRARTSRIEARLAQAADAQLASLHNACGLAKLVSEPLNDEIRRRIKAGEMKGWSLAKDSEARDIKSAKRAIPRIVLSRLLTRDQLLELCELPVGRVETLHRKVNKVTAKQAKADINKALEGEIEREPRKPKILKP